LTIIIYLLKENKQISTIAIAEKLNATKRTILRYIEKLKNLNLIKRVGGEKTGYWHVIHKNSSED